MVPLVKLILELGLVHGDDIIKYPVATVSITVTLSCAIVNDGMSIH